MEQPSLFRTGKCVDCGIGFVAGRTSRVRARCVPCGTEHEKARQRAAMKARYVPVKNIRVCADCDCEYDAPGRDTNSLRCPPCRVRNKAEWKRAWAETNALKAHQSKRAWYEANKALVKAYKHRRRVLARTEDADRFTAQEIFERDGWTCQLCGKHLDPAVKYPSNDSPSLDHIIPIALGGPHTLANVQAACMGCNRSKGARRIA